MSTVINFAAACEVRQHYPSTVFGDDGLLWPSNDSSGYMKYVFVNFDISNITPGDVTSAILKFYTYGADAQMVEVKRALASINESTTCWNNMPSVTTTHSVSGEQDDFSYIYLDVTDMLQDETRSTFTIRIGGLNDGDLFYIDTTRILSVTIDEFTYPTTDYYVNASTGSDLYTGSIDYPWKSLDHAAREVPDNVVLHLTGPFTSEPTPNKISPISSNVIYVWTSSVTVENNN